MVFIIIVVRVAISRAHQSAPYNSGNFNSENNGGKMVRLQRRKKKWIVYDVPYISIM